MIMVYTGEIVMHGTEDGFETAKPRTARPFGYLGAGSALAGNRPGAVVVPE